MCRNLHLEVLRGVLMAYIGMQVVVSKCTYFF